MHHVHTLLWNGCRIGTHREVHLQMRRKAEDDNYTIKRKENNILCCPAVWTGIPG
jgi:hypothetical protein